MSGEQAVVVNEGVSEEENAAFLAEMASEVEEVEAKAPAKDEEAVKVEEVAPVTPAVERKEVIKGFTEEEIRAALELLPKLQKSIDTVGGTFGTKLADQQQLITQLQEERKAVGRLSAEKLTRLHQEYPELAEIIASDLNDNIGNGEAADPKQMEQVARSVVTEQLLQDRRERELKGLAEKHNDWKETASFSIDGTTIRWANPKFGEWVQKQAPEVASKIAGQFDARFVAQQLDKFKDASKKPVENSLTDAVLPRGTRRSVAPTTGLTEEEAAFRAEMARR